MKKIIYTLLLLAAFVHSGNAQLVSYSLQQSFTEQQLDSFLNTTGFSLPVSPQYDIVVYQLI